VDTYYFTPSRGFETAKTHEHLVIIVHILQSFGAPILGVPNSSMPRSTRGALPARPASESNQAPTLPDLHARLCIKATRDQRVYHNA